MCRSTFEQLDHLLAEVCVGLDGKTDWPPSQDKECMAVAGLNLLNLQVSKYPAITVKRKIVAQSSFCFLLNKSYFT